jgi:small subunit ribosomal protein S2
MNNNMAAKKKDSLRTQELKESRTQDKGRVTAEDLFEAGAHFGHTVKRWNPKMKKFIWGKKAGVHIFDLEKTVTKIDEACEALEKLAAEGKNIVLVGTKRQAKEVVQSVAKEIKVGYVTERWLGGIITNWKQVKSRIDKMIDLKKKRESGELKKYTKKEQILFDRQISRLEKFLGGLADLKIAPEVLVIVDTHKERSAVREAANKNLPIIGIVDSNGNPDPIRHLVPMNDDATKAIEIVVKLFSQAIAAGKAKIVDSI